MTLGMTTAGSPVAERGRARQLVARIRYSGVVRRPYRRWIDPDFGGFFGRCRGLVDEARGISPQRLVEDTLIGGEVVDG